MRSSWCFSSISATITLLSFPGWNWNSSTIATLLDRFCPWKQQNLSERGQFLYQKPAWESKPKGGCIRVLVQLCSTVCVRENHKISANGQKRLIHKICQQSYAGNQARAFHVTSSLPKMLTSTSWIILCQLDFGQRKHCPCSMA